MFCLRIRFSVRACVCTLAYICTYSPGMVCYMSCTYACTCRLPHVCSCAFLSIFAAATCNFAGKPVGTSTPTVSNLVLSAKHGALVGVCVNMRSHLPVCIDIDTFIHIYTYIYICNCIYIHTKRFLQIPATGHKPASIHTH